MVDRPDRDAPPPDLLGPPPQTRDPGQPPWWVVAAVIGGAVVACYVVWLLTDTWVGNALADGRAWWVPVTALAAAGGLWALLMGGGRVIARAGLGVAAGAVSGVIGSLLLGSGDTHADAFGDTLLSGGSLLRALLWGAFTAVAWAVTLGAASVRERIAHVAAGAAVGGFATGVGMGLLAGTNLFGDRVVPTDLWWPVPLRDYDAEATVLPLLLLSIGVPITIAAITRLAPTAAGRSLLTAAVAALFVPLLAGVAGYLTDLDEARRDGTYAGASVEPPTLPDDLAVPDDSDPAGPESSPVPDDTAPADTSAADSQPAATDAAPADSTEGNPSTDSGGTPPDTGIAPSASDAPTTNTPADVTPSSDSAVATDPTADVTTTDAVTSDPGASDPITTDAVPTDTVPTDAAPSDPVTSDPGATDGPATSAGDGSDPASPATDLTAPADTSAGTAPEPAGSAPSSPPADSTPDSLPTDSVPPPSDPAGSEPAGSEPAAPGGTVAVPFDAGIDFVATYTGVATNDNGETADVLIAVGRAAPPDDVDLVWPGPPTCAPEGAAVIPFVIEVRTADPAVTYLDVRFSQGAVAPDAVADHPMTIEFHDPDGTTRCADATAPETSNTPAFTAWPAITADTPGYAYGYFIVDDFFAGDAASAADAAAVAVVPIVNTVVTSTEATFEGTAPRDFTDPVSGEAAQALVLVP